MRRKNLSTKGKSSTELHRIPSVEKLKQAPRVAELLRDLSDEFVTGIVREVLEEIRLAHKQQPSGREQLHLEQIEEAVVTRIRERLTPPLRRVINGTGIVIHTNLGRSLLGEKVRESVVEVAGSYCNLEYNLATGERGHRDAVIEPLLCALTGAEAATVVNNNAGAVMIALDTLAKGREVIVSRGELIEIGGSFRIPDVMAKSGAKLVEVGTTNRTYITDYERALSPETGLLLKVHPSNYRIIGFTHQTSLAELVQLGNKRAIPVMEDLGSGAFIDMSRYGICEPLVRHSVQAGADIVTFSGDKLLGGPQAGIILGKREFIKEIRRNALMRALRLDKMTLAALGALLQILASSRSPEKEIPTLAMIARSEEEILQLARQAYDSLEPAVRDALQPEVVAGHSQVGGGSCPEQTLPSFLLALKARAVTPDEIAVRLRAANPPIIGIIRNDAFCLDFRTIRPEELADIAGALRSLAATPGAHQ